MLEDKLIDSFIHSFTHSLTNLCMSIMFQELNKSVKVPGLTEHLNMLKKT